MKRYLGLLLLVGAVSAYAGGGPQNVLIVVNDASIESQELGHYYAEQRGIPQRHLCHVNVPVNAYNMAWSAFRTSVYEKVHSHISSQKLSNQIDYVVFTKDMPSRVGDNEGATSVMYYGFKNAPRFDFGVGTCTMPTNTKSFYFRAEKSFRHSEVYGGTNYYLSFMLENTSLAFCISNVSRGVQADHSHPVGTIFLLEPTYEPQRNIRFVRFNDVDFNSRFFTPFPERQIRVLFDIADETNLIGYMTGRKTVPDAQSEKNNTYLPGAIADHLTSFGGRLPLPPDNQDPATAWIDVGASASYGTVWEPCAYLEKFPDPMVHFWYGRGFNLAESYWMSVANPYNGIFLGEPLAAPYAYPPGVMFNEPSEGEMLSGTVTVSVTAVTNEIGVQPTAIDLFLDDRYKAGLGEAPPLAGNMLEAVVGGVTSDYTVVAGDGLFDAVEGLAGSINAAGGLVRATNLGDRIELSYTNPGVAGSWISYSAQTYAGTAAYLRVHGTSLTTNLLDSIYRARRPFSLNGTAKTGDTVTTIFTLTNGLMVTNFVVASEGESANSVIGRLISVINAEPLLVDSNGVRANAHSLGTAYPNASFDARKPGPGGYNILVDYEIDRAFPMSGLKESDSFSGRLDENAYDLAARGMLLFNDGAMPLNGEYAWDTTDVPNGRHRLRAVAAEGRATRTQGHSVISIAVSNSPLTCHILTPLNGSAVTYTNLLQLTAVASNSVGVVTQMAFYVEGKLAGVDAFPPFELSVDTRDYGVGILEVRAEAFDSGGVNAWSDVNEIHVLRNWTLDTDGDMVADAWEQQHFGGLELFGSSGDPDADEWDNLAEYISDTDPNNGDDLFMIDISPTNGSQMAVSFGSSTGRVYVTHFSDESLTNAFGWQQASPSPFAGNGGITSWIDDGSETGSDPGTVHRRTYRMEVEIP